VLPTVHFQKDGYDELYVSPRRLLQVIGIPSSARGERVTRNIRTTTAIGIIIAKMRNHSQDDHACSMNRVEHPQQTEALATDGMLGSCTLTLMLLSPLRVVTTDLD